MNKLSFIVRRTTLIAAFGFYAFCLLNTCLKLYNFDEYETYIPLISMAFLALSFRYAIPTLKVVQEFGEKLHKLTFNQRRIIACVSIIPFLIILTNTRIKLFDLGPYNIWIGMPCMLVGYWGIFNIMPAVIDEMQDYRDEMIRREIQDYEDNNKKEE